LQIDQHVALGHETPGGVKRPLLSIDWKGTARALNSRSPGTLVKITNRHSEKLEILEVHEKIVKIVSLESVQVTNLYNFCTG